MEGVGPGSRRAEPVELRKVRAPDIDAFVTHQADSVAQSAAVFAADADDRSLRLRWERILEAPAVQVRTIEVAGRVAGRVAGHVLLWRDDEMPGPEISYWVGREYWGAGIATAAVRQFVDDLRERPLYGRAARTNVASVRVLEKCGFVRVKTLAASAPDDSLVEEVVYRLDR